MPAALPERDAAHGVWDGDQVLWEISAPGWTGATSSQMEQDTGFHIPVATSSFMVASEWRDSVDYLPMDSVPQADIAPRAFFFGRVMYVHGPGIDAPLSLTRFEYSDSIPQPVTIFPSANWRGSYALGTYGAQDGHGAGGTVPPCRTITREPDFQEIVHEPNLSQEPRAFDPRYAQWRHCVEILWPAPHEYVTRSQKGTPTRLGPPSWTGSLLDGMRDVSGMMYRRNRYYDPGTGQFTQEDPIGLAGGLNLYGFANGDPVTYADPFGLRPQDVYVACRPVDATDDFGHCAVRIVNERLNVDITYELLSDGVWKPQRVGQTSPEETARYSNWARVSVREGQSSDEFDLNVLTAAEQLSEERNGRSYWPSGGVNSNRFIYDVTVVSR